MGGRFDAYGGGWVPALFSVCVSMLTFVRMDYSGYLRCGGPGLGRGRGGCAGGVEVC